MEIDEYGNVKQQDWNQNNFNSSDETWKTTAVRFNVQHELKKQLKLETLMNKDLKQN